MNNQKGMTLIELIIVVVIMGLMFILSTTFLTATTSHSKLKSAVRDVATEMQMARMKAIYQNKEFMVEFSASGTSPFGYRLRKGNLASASTSWTDDHVAVAGYNTSPTCSSLNESGYFCIEGVTITHTSSGNYVEFNPNGSAYIPGGPNGSLTFTATNVPTKTITIVATTGRVYIQ